MHIEQIGFMCIRIAIAHCLPRYEDGIIVLQSIDDASPDAA